MPKLILPKSECIFGPQKSRVFEIIEEQARTSDVAIGTGGCPDSLTHVRGDKSLKGRPRILLALR